MSQIRHRKTLPTFVVSLKRDNRILPFVLYKHANYACNTPAERRSKLWNLHQFSL